MLDSKKVEALFLRSIQLARKGWGNTHPNPMVGALILENGEVVAEGFHAGAGKAHAEVEAFTNLNRRPSADAIMFVSMEPCSTHGRTPPCVDAIINSGIKNIYLCALDPNPSHSGAGVDKLREAGVSVHLAPMGIESQATRLNFIFNHNMDKCSPMIALKTAETVNGMVAENQGAPSQITEAEARVDMMHWRRLFPAICIGVGTLIADNPSLTVRIPNEPVWCPVRLVLDSRLNGFSRNISDRNIYTDAFSEQTIVLTTETGLRSSYSVGRAKELGVRLLKVGSDMSGRAMPNALRNALLELKLNGVYCEGGPTFAKSLLSANQVDYVFRYKSKKVFDGLNALPGPFTSGIKIHKPIEKNLGNDQLVHGFL